MDNIVLEPAWIKIRLIKEGLKKDKCEECGQGNVWRGKKITLILDHRNGNRYDFRFENLRIAFTVLKKLIERGQKVLIHFYSHYRSFGGQK